MIIFISIISSFVAGLGIGGGSLFILLRNIFNIMSVKEAIVYNLIMFITVGIFATYDNIKNKKFDKNLFFKFITYIIIGSLIGSLFANITNEEKLKLYFNIFVMVIGIYEIISSLFFLKK